MKALHFDLDMAWHQDDVVSEEEVFEYFTTDEYKPEAALFVEGGISHASVTTRAINRHTSSSSVKSTSGQAVIVGHQMPHEEVKRLGIPLGGAARGHAGPPRIGTACRDMPSQATKPRHAYVHFSDNTAAKKARKEKDGGAIGKALASCLLLIFTNSLPV